MRGRIGLASGRHDRGGAVSGDPRSEGRRSRASEPRIRRQHEPAPLVSTVQLFRTGDTPLPDVIILTHKLTREYGMGSELVRALRGVSLPIPEDEYVAV